MRVDGGYWFLRKSKFLLDENDHEGGFSPTRASLRWCGSGIVNPPAMDWLVYALILFVKKHAGMLFRTSDGAPRTRLYCYLGETVVTFDNGFLQIAVKDA